MLKFKKIIKDHHVVLDMFYFQTLTQHVLPLQQRMILCFVENPLKSCRVAGDVVVVVVVVVAHAAPVQVPVLVQTVGVEDGHNHHF